MTLGDCCILREVTGGESDNSGTSADYEFDTEVYRDSGSFTLSGTTGIQVTDAGPYLLVSSQSHDATGTTRSELLAAPRINGTDQLYGQHSSYVRRASDGNVGRSCGMTILELAANDTVTIGHSRKDSNTGSGLLTRRAGEGHISLVKLDDGWEYFLGRGTASQTLTNSVVTPPGAVRETALTWTDLQINTQDRIDSEYTHNTVTNNDEITLAGETNYLICFTVKFYNSLGARRNGVARLEIDGSPVFGSITTGYARGSNDCRNPVAAGAVIYTARTADEVLKLQAAAENESSGNLDVQEFAICIVKLGTSNGTRGFGAYNLSDFDADTAVATFNPVSWTTLGIVGLGGFSIDGTVDSRINLTQKNPGRYLLWSAFATTRDAINNTRKRPTMRLRYNDNSSDVELPYGYGDNYNRGDQSTTSTWMAGGIAGGVYDLSAPQYIEASANDAATTTNADHIWMARDVAFFGLKLDTLQASAADIEIVDREAGLVLGAATPSIDQGANVSDTDAEILVGAPAVAVAVGVLFADTDPQAVLAATDPDVAQGTNQEIESGALLLGASAPSSGTGIGIEAEPGRLLFEGPDPVVGVGVGIADADPDLRLSGFEPTVGSGVLISQDGSVLLGAPVPETATGVVITQDGSVLLLGPEPQVAAGVAFSASAAPLTVDAAPSAVGVGINVSDLDSSLLLGDLDGAASTGVLIQQDGSLLITSTDPVVEQGSRFAAAVGQLVVEAPEALPGLGVSITEDGEIVLGAPSPTTTTGTEVDTEILAGPAVLVLGLKGVRIVNGTQYFHNRERIQNKLIELAQDGVFLPAQFSPTTGMMKILDLDYDQVSPSAVLCDEVNTLATDPRRNRQTGRRERTTWTFELQLVFAQAVSVEVFERELAENVPLIKKDETKGLPQVRLNWLDTRYEHPPLQQPSSGTRATMTFEADLSPV